VAHFALNKPPPSANKLVGNRKTKKENMAINLIFVRLTL
jgi:hypothetical protein